VEEGSPAELLGRPGSVFKAMREALE